MTVQYGGGGIYSQSRHNNSKLVHCTIANNTSASMEEVLSARWTDGIH